MIIPWKNIRRFSAKFLSQPLYACCVGYKRAKGFLAYYFKGGRSPLPEAITLFLTYRCNLRCKMCGQWGESGVTKTSQSENIKEEIPLDILKDFIDKVAVFKPSITLFGGEPLLYSGCIDLIKHIKRKKMHALMITNGAMIKGHMEKIAESGLDDLNVSLDGGEKLHDEIRGMDGLYAKITGGLKELAAYKRSKGIKNPLVNLQCTITKYNYEQLEELLEVAREIKANSLTFHNLIFIGQDLIERQKEYDERLKCSSKNWEGFVFKPEIDPEKLFLKIKSILSGKYPFAADFYPNLSLKGLRQYYNNPSYKPSEYPERCLSPWVCAYVFPDGEVRPCLNSTYSFGNIKEDGFINIWNSKKAVSFRRILKKSKLFPACVRCTELYRY